MAATLHRNLVVLARVLERLEKSAVPVDPDQYRAVVNHLAVELAGLSHDAAIENLLETFPATAEIYENLRYASHGLCRSPLARSLDAELGARCAISRIRGLRVPPPH